MSPSNPVENTLEFFTMKESLDEFEKQIAREIKINADGKASASIRGTARLAGVSHTTLNDAFTPGSKNPSKLYRLLVQHKFKPETFSETGVPDIAVGLVVKYYAWMNGERCTEQAKQTDLIFGSFGTRVWMQKITGWQEPKANAGNLIRDFVIAQLPEKPSDYQVRFPVRFWDALEELYGLRRGHRGCASFINAYIYDFFPVEIRERLDEINPLNDSGNRCNKQHQHFDDVLLQVLIEQIERVITLLQISDTKAEFAHNMKKLKPYRFTQDTVLKLEENDS